MSMGSFHQYTPDGRIRGSYVYMLLCQLDGPIHIKVGMSSDPFKRLNDLRVACPVIPRIIALAEVISHRRARRLEAALHKALDRWHTHLEWFKVEPSEKPQFNAAIQPVIAAHSLPSRPIEWRRYDVAKIIAEGQRRSRFKQMEFRRRGRAYQDFVTDQAGET